MTTSIKTDAQLADDLQNAEKFFDSEAIISAESAICERLDISLDETEQGLTRSASDAIDDFLRKHSV